MRDKVNNAIVLRVFLVLFAFSHISTNLIANSTLTYEQNATGLPRPEGLAMTDESAIATDLTMTGKEEDEDNVQCEEQILDCHCEEQCDEAIPMIEEVSDTKEQNATRTDETIITNDRIITERFVLYYFQDGINLDPEYLDNKRNMDHINEYLAKSPQIDSIAIYAYASPEGVYERNLWLSKRRAEAARRYILEINPNLSRTKIILHPMAENWEGFYEEVYNNYFREDREAVLKILQNKKIKNDTKKWRLKQLDKGRTWKYLIENNMPQLRLATWMCVWESLDVEIPELEPVQIIEEEIYIEDEPLALNETIISPKPVKEKVTIFNVKTNLLYDAITALNIEAEIPLGKKFSIAIEDVFPWWTWGPNQKKFAFQMWEMGIEPRWWFRRVNHTKFKRDNFYGHFLGIYAMTSMYDFQKDFDYCYQGEYWSLGVSYGFSFAISKYFNLEFSAALGYLNSDYRHYQPDPAYEHLYKDKFKVGVFQYFGPTKLKIALVLPITVWRKVR